ncbi:MAG: hypothetical protein EOO41_03205, partial [Methanobacteriota archaeon]
MRRAREVEGFNNDVTAMKRRLQELERVDARTQRTRAERELDAAVAVAAPIIDALAEGLPLSVARGRSASAGRARGGRAASNS